MMEINSKIVESSHGGFKQSYAIVYLKPRDLMAPKPEPMKYGFILPGDFGRTPSVHGPFYNYNDAVRAAEDGLRKIDELNYKADTTNSADNLRYEVYISYHGSWLRKHLLAAFRTYGEACDHKNLLESREKEARKHAEGKRPTIRHSVWLKEDDGSYTILDNGAPV